MNHISIKDLAQPIFRQELFEIRDHIDKTIARLSETEKSNIDKILKQVNYSWHCDYRNSIIQFSSNTNDRNRSGIL